MNRKAPLIQADLLSKEMGPVLITTVVITEKGRTKTAEDVDESTTRYVY